jgi:hypothetical protein
MAARALIIADWRARDGSVVGVTLRDAPTGGASYVMADIRHDDPGFASRLEAWIARAETSGERIRDERGQAAEPVTLADGPALQGVVPGVAPVPLQARQIEALQHKRAARRGAAPLPSGGLFDDVARAQQDLFA